MGIDEFEYSVQYPSLWGVNGTSIVPGSHGFSVQGTQSMSSFRKYLSLFLHCSCALDTKLLDGCISLGNHQGILLVEVLEA